MSNMTVMCRPLMTFLFSDLQRQPLRNVIRQYPCCSSIYQSSRSEKKFEKIQNAIQCAIKKNTNNLETTTTFWLKPCRSISFRSSIMTFVLKLMSLQKKTRTVVSCASNQPGKAERTHKSLESRIYISFVTSSSMFGSD